MTTVSDDNALPRRRPVPVPQSERVTAAAAAHDLAILKRIYDGLRALDSDSRTG